MSAAAKRAHGHAATAQRPAAAPDASVWVAASAGTGKTKVLTDRVLSLLLHGTPPARILCLTFTKAAAAEMANRLSQRLARWAIIADADLAGELRNLFDREPDAEMSARARQLFAHVLDAPGGMKIQTIHAFCQSLLGRFPLEAGIAPHFQVLDERSAAELQRRAREDVLATAQDETSGAHGTMLAAAIAEISVHAQEDSFAELIAKLIGERARLTRLIDRHGGSEGVVAAIYRVLGLAPDTTAAAILQRACADEAFDGDGLRRAARAMAEGSVKDRAHAAPMTAWLDDPAARPARFARYLAAFFTDKGKGERFKTLVYKDALAAAPGIDDVLAAEAERLAAVRDELRALEVAGATAALVRLGSAILDAYAGHKSARALLDYDDLILGARDLLARQGSASWVLFKLDGGLDHILIDEAQDTNPDQWDVIAALAAEFFVGTGARETPRTVFAVGDAKQSIYSFQRADPSAFGRMRTFFAERAHGAGQEWVKVDLAHSFRSCAAVLQAVDAVFAPGHARDGVLFDDEAALHHEAVRIGQGGTVELWPPAEPATGDQDAPWQPPLDRRGATPARSRLARLIARRIWGWTTAPDAEAGDDTRLLSKDRRLRPGDILVLVRRRNAFVEELVRELKRLDVPVAGVDRMVLREQLAVMDLIALGRVLLLPEDDLTLATVLKGPLVGLSEEQLFTLAYNRRGSLWDSLRATANGGGDPAIVAAYHHLSALLARADFVPPHELFADILARDWGGESGREVLLARLGPEANDPIEELLSLTLDYEREHVPSLEGFLHWLEVGAQEVKRDMEHGRDSVRVMTVHGAKGLQAPVVILPDTLQTPPARGGLLWLAQDDSPDGDLLIWSPRKDTDGPLTRAARAARSRAQEREYRRLLYVALTRAEDRLYVCGWQTGTAIKDDSWYALVAAALADIGDTVTFDFSAEIEGGWVGEGQRLTCPQAAPAESEREDLPAQAGTPEPLPAWARTAPPPEPSPPRPLAPSRPSASEPAVISPLGTDDGGRFRRGRLIHRLLQSLPDMPAAARPAAATRLLASPLYNLSAADQEEIAAASLAVLAHADFAPLFGPGSRAEVSIAGLLGNNGQATVVAGQIDRLVVTDDAVLILDYKSNRPAPRQERDVPAVYIRQMAAYRAVLARIYPAHRISCALLWTDGPRLMQLSDEILETRAP